MRAKNKISPLLIFGIVLISQLYILMNHVDPGKSWSDFTVTSLNGYQDAFHGLSGVHVAAIALFFFITAFFGNHLSAFLFEKDKNSFVVKLISSFLLGYLATVGAVRLISLFIPKNYLLPATVLLLVSGSIIAKRSQPKEAVPNHYLWLDQLLPALIGLGLLLIFLLSSVHLGDHDWTGHGETHLAFFLKDLRLNQTTHFPVIRQHYDEVLYSWLLYQLPNLTCRPVVLLWMVNSVMKVSAAFLLFRIFRNLDLTRANSIAFSAFLMMGTFSLNLAQYYLLFDSFNPFYLVLHPGRIAGILLLFSLLAWSVKQPRIQMNRSSLVFWVLTGIGISGGPFHNAIFILGYTIFFICGVQSFPNIKARFWFFMTLCFAVAAPFLTYSLKPLNSGVLLFSSGVLLLAAFILFAIKNTAVAPLNKANSSLRQTWAILLIVFASAFLLLGNLFVNDAAVSLLASTPINPFPKSFDTLAHTTFFTQCSAGSYGFHKPFSEYDRGGIYFMSYYGLIYLAGILALYLGQARGKQQNPDNTLNNLMRNLIALSFGLMPLCFFYVDFINDISFSWVKSRMLEFPVYVILFCSLVIFGRSTNRMLRLAASIVCWIHVVIPIAMTQRIDQWALNLKSILERLL